MEFGAKLKSIISAINFCKEIARKVDVSNPVMQIYINNHDIHSTIGFNNYLSTFFPDNSFGGNLSIDVFNKSGIKIKTIKNKLGHFESSFLDIRKALHDSLADEEYGIVALQFIPSNIYSKKLKKLGKLSAYFFMIYEGKSCGRSIAHTNVTLDPSSGGVSNYISSQIIWTNNLEGLDVYQSNPTRFQTTLNIALINSLDPADKLEKSITIAPYGVEKVSFGKFEFLSNINYRVGVSILPGGNSKPLICRCYGENGFSISHA